MEPIHYYLGFSYFMGIGPIKFAQLIQHYKDIERAYNVSLKELAEIIGPKTAQEFINFRQKISLKNELQKVKEKNIYVCIKEDEYYPQSLRNLVDAPICLYIKGDRNLINFQKNLFVSIVGTRRPTAYGQTVTKGFAEKLSAAGIIIVSGMAMGIDAYAHTAALTVKGTTIAVLGCGVDMPYPRQNYFLYERIIKSGGLVISEFPPGMFAQKGTFVSRNRLISGLSQVTLVVEGAENSGSLITARCAAEQGKEIFAIPGAIDSELSIGPHLLIKEGAQIATSVQDIFDVLVINTTYSTKKNRESLLENVSKEEKEIIELLYKQPQTIEEFSLIYAHPMPVLLQQITILEIKGIITKRTDGKMQVTV